MNGDMLRWRLYSADSRFAPSQLETALLCNDVSHWLGASLESTLRLRCIAPVYPYTLWRHGLETFQTLLTLCEGNQPMTLQRASDADLWCFLRYYPEQTAKQTVNLSMIWDAMTLMWRGCNEQICSRHRAGHKDYNTKLDMFSEAFFGQLRFWITYHRAKANLKK